VSRASVAPGRRSLEGLDWLVRVGASPLEPWGLVMGWRRTVTYDHARRLAAAGLVRMVRMTRGDGSLAASRPIAQFLGRACTGATDSAGVFDTVVRRRIRRRPLLST